MHIDLQDKINHRFSLCENLKGMEIIFMVAEATHSNNISAVFACIYIGP